MARANGVDVGVGVSPNGLGVGIGEKMSGEMVGGVLPSAEPVQATAMAMMAGKAASAIRLTIKFIPGHLSRRLALMQITRAVAG
jgi:hypothetical protein